MRSGSKRAVPYDGGGGSDDRASASGAESSLYASPETTTTVFQVHKRPRTTNSASPPTSAQVAPPLTQNPLPYAPYIYAPPAASILSSMSAESTAALQRTPPTRATGRLAASIPNVSVPAAPASPAYHCSLSTGASIHSPRRALVCSSLEQAALASSLRTHSSIHPAILHSLSVRLQCMDDKDADVVIQRLKQLAQYMEQGQDSKGADTRPQPTSQPQAPSPRTSGQLPPPHSAGPASNTSPSQRSMPAAGKGSGSGSSSGSRSGRGSASGIPPSPMPPLSSSSSSITQTNSDADSSNTTSPTISPAARAQDAPSNAVPHSPSMRHMLPLQQHVHMQQIAAKSTAAPRTPPQQGMRGAQQREGSGSAQGQHPPLHPTSQSTSPSHYTRMLLASSGRHHHSPSQTQLYSHQFKIPSPQVSSLAPTADPPQLSSGPPPAPLTRSHSEDGDIPAGLLMLIEALPGASNQTSNGGQAPVVTPATATAATHTGSAADPMAQLHEARREEGAGAAAAASDQVAHSGSMHATLMPPTALQRSTSC